jgi:sporulation protein YlmC with PRC-barrel domain
MGETRRSATLAPGGLVGSAASTEAARRVDSASAPAGPGPNVMAASALEGETVLNHQGDTLGEIEDVVLDVNSGRIAYAVLGTGGFLGIGEKYFAVPWRALTLDSERKCFLLDVDKDALANAPGFDRDHWPQMSDESWAGDIHRLYGTDPYWK